MARGDMARMRRRTGLPIRRGSRLIWHLPGQDVPATVLSVDGDFLCISVRTGDQRERYRVHPFDHTTWLANTPRDSSLVQACDEPLPLDLEGAR